MSPSSHPTVSGDTPDVIELFRVIQGLLPKATIFEGTIVRSVGAKYATLASFFSGAGAEKTGGRWNRPGIEAVYASLDILTATNEAYQNLLHYRMPLSSIRPRVTAGARVALSTVMDLTDSAVRRRLGFTVRELVEEDWRSLQHSGVESWTQAIGRGCFLAGFESMVVPSARNHGGKNIVLFPKNLHKSSKLEILGASELRSPNSILQ